MAENSQGGVGQDAIDLLRNARTQIIDELSRDNLPGTSDRHFHRKLMMWMLVMFTLLLSCEWVIRRLHKLA